MKHARKVISYWRERGFKQGGATFRQLKEIQGGELKGVDRFGNQYWEDNTAVFGRNRYVVYPSRKQVNASAVPPEWHSWLHYMNDETPVDAPPPVMQYKLGHQQMTLSKQGVEANYLPPGHILSDRHTTYGATGAGAEDKLDGAYAAWKSSKANANPETAPKWATKTERR